MIDDVFNIFATFPEWSVEAVGGLQLEPDIRKETGEAIEHFAWTRVVALPSDASHGLVVLSDDRQEEPGDRSYEGKTRNSEC
jgi:hypothetical protein